jgi:lipid-A-disaccharide synthase
LKELRRLKPDGLVLIDFYKFNIGLAKVAKEMGIPVVYYVPPKLWVWGKWRMQTLKKYIDQILAIFPFEESFYRSQDVPVAFVGNPLLEILDNNDTDEFKSRYSIYSDEDTFVGLLPGSRLAEIQRMLPVFLEAAQLISREVPGTVRFLMPLAHTIDRSIVERILDNSPVVVVLVEGEAQNVLKIADVSLIASGTATLEAFLLGAPQVVAYRTSWFTYTLGSRIINVPRVSLPNILAGKDVVVELLQDQVIPERLARSALEMLENSDRRDAYLEAAIEVRNNLGKGNASLTAAQATLSVCGL